MGATIEAVGPAVMQVKCCDWVDVPGNCPICGTTFVFQTCQCDET